MEQSVRLEAQDRQFYLTLAIISGQQSRKGSINTLNNELQKSASDILETLETDTSNKHKLKKILGG